MKLITETIQEIQFIAEQTADGEKRMWIEGIMLQGNVKNRNGRVYPMNVLDKEVTRYMKESVKANKAYGELGHPQGPTINLDRVSHMIKDLRKEGTNYVGRALISKTPMGDIVTNLIKDEANLGVSSRGLGSLKSAQWQNEEANLVQDDFHLATAADIVADPSGPSAFVRGIMENVEYWYDPVTGSFKEETVHKMKKVMRKMTVEQLEANKFKLFEDYINLVLKKQ